jgi:hypothetical protein
MVLKDSIEDYSTFWGVSNIIIRKIPIKEGIECDKGNYPNCDYIDVFGSGATGYPVENFVTLCSKQSDGEKIYDNCEIAKLMVYYNELQ